MMRLAHTTAAWNSSYRNWEMEWWLITKSKIFEIMTFSLLSIFTFIAVIVFCKQLNSASDTYSIVFQEINKTVNIIKLTKYLWIFMQCNFLTQQFEKNIEEKKFNERNQKLLLMDSNDIKWTVQNQKTEDSAKYNNKVLYENQIELKQQWPFSTYIS